MYRVTLLILAALTVMLTLALPALAEHNSEHVQQTTQALMDAYLPPGYGSYSGIAGVDPLSGYMRQLFLYDLAAICQNYGGYYYDGGDGYVYWHDCAGAMH